MEVKVGVAIELRVGVPWVFIGEFLLMNTVGET
jgi:hypothetical protein